MDRVRTCRGRCGWCAADIAERNPFRFYLAQPRFYKGPPTHVSGLFLSPEKLCSIWVRGKDLSQPGCGKRIELLEPNDRDTTIAGIDASGIKIVVDLAAADDDTPDRLLVGDRNIVDDRLKTVGGKVIDRRARRWQAQQTLRRHRN